MLIFTVSCPLSGQDVPADQEDSGIDPSLFSFTLSTGIEYPIEISDRDLITLGFGTDLTGSLPFPFLRYLFPALNLSYSYIPVRADTSLSVISFGGGILLSLEPIPRLMITSLLSAGGYLSLFNENQVSASGVPYDDQAGGSFQLTAGLGVTFFLTPFFSLGVSAAYRYYHGMYHGIRGSLATALHVSGFQRKVDLYDIRFEEVYPVLFKYYDEAPLGSAGLINRERFPIEDIEVTVFSKRFMDRPKKCLSPESLRSGESGAVSLNALFTDRVLGIEEGTKVAAEVIVAYTMNGVRRETKTVESLRIHNRNALTWDDDRKAAAFISTKDPSVLRLSKMVGGMVRKESYGAVNLNMRMGMALYEALSTYGLNYVIDPNTPSYEEASGDVSVIDFIQFPYQTLYYRGGDCDDLSILFCSLLEAIGIQTALITIPGHIFMAFSLDISQEEARKAMDRSDLLILHDDTVWVPVEMTKIGAGFTEAWSSGAHQWSAHNVKGAARFYPIHDCWLVYEASGTPQYAMEIPLPEEARVKSAYLEEVRRFTERELYPQIAEYERAIRNSDEPTALRNRLGVLYARYGLLERAEEIFTAILRDERYDPAMINLASLYYQRGELDRAKELYEQVEKTSPSSKVVLLNLSRIYYRQNRSGLAEGYYTRLKRYYPELAERFDYLSSAQGSASSDEGRALDIVRLEGLMIWEDEP